MKKVKRFIIAAAAVMIAASSASCSKGETEKVDNLDSATREELASISAKDERLTGELENKTIKWMANW